MTELKHAFLSTDSASKALERMLQRILPTKKEIKDLGPNPSIEDAIEFGASKAMNHEREVMLRAIEESKQHIVNHLTNNMLELTIILKESDDPIVSNSLLVDKDGKYFVNNNSLTLLESREYKKVNVYAVFDRSEIIEVDDYYIMHMPTKQGFELLLSHDQFDADTANYHYIISPKTHKVAASTDEEFVGPGFSVDFLWELMKSLNSNNPLSTIYVSKANNIVTEKMDSNMEDAGSINIIYYKKHNTV